MKSEVNLLSLLSTFEDVIDALPEEKEGVSQKEENVKLPRTNSLEDLGIKVCITFRKNSHLFIYPSFVFLTFSKYVLLNHMSSSGFRQLSFSAFSEHSKSE